MYTYIHYTVSLRRDLWADMQLAPWALIQQMFKPPSNFSTPLEQTKWLDVCKFGGHYFTKLLLGTCCIALKPCRSQSYFLGAVKRPFVFCESWLCLWIGKFVINLRKCFCVLTYASLTERILSSNFSWARILLCFYSSWTREFTVAYACWLANLKLVEFPVNCQGNVNRNELEAKLKVN